MIDQKKYEEERKRISQRYGIPAKKPDVERTSRYMEYRKQEQLREEMRKNPEKFKPVENNTPSEPELKIEPIIEEKQSKKSWFSKLLGKN